MTAAKKDIAPQQLETVQRALGGELCRALEPLTSKLDYAFIAPRAYAELREAKSLLSYLKYPDSTMPVSSDEMAWAIKLVAESYRADGEAESAAVLHEAARILGIDPAQPHAISADLNRKISNELRLSGGDEPVEAPLAVAVA
ncbi:MAG: hypothetical protein KGI29_07270 [Pseudomonadota bacterium]|nr:hypothetical protein [Pseudomonadota bacterium]MDE3038420.1 hypothetical protein [Pseudomonadota bacterium]